MCLGELAALPDALLATLQINIALGILYWALKDSRYRDELFDRIVEAIEELKAPAKKADDEELHASLLKTNRKFTVDHHTVSMWRTELPERYDSSITNSSVTGR